MARKAQDVTDAELGVLQVLWKSGPSTIRNLTAALYRKAGVSQYATVQKLLERLEVKGCVTRDRSANVHVFSAAVDQDELIGRRLESLAKNVCGGSWTPIVSHLLQAGPLTADERASLRALIDQLAPRKRGRD